MDRATVFVAVATRYFGLFYSILRIGSGELLCVR